MIEKVVCICKLKILLNDIGISYKIKTNKTINGWRCLQGCECRRLYKDLSIGNLVKFFSVYIYNENNLKRIFR